MKGLKVLSLVVLGVMTFFRGEVIQAATITAAATGDWSNTATWTGGVIPGASDDVVIGSGRTVTLSDNRTCASLTITASTTFSFAILEINAGNTLTVSGNCSLNSTTSFATSVIDLEGSLSVGGGISFSSSNPVYANIIMNYAGASLSIGGSITGQTAGTIEVSPSDASTFIFNGSGAQSLPTSATIGFHSITWNNPNTLTLNRHIDIPGSFNINNGGVDVDVYDITIGGNFSNSGTFNARSRTVTLDGTAEQTITTDGESFYDLIINNTSAAGVTLNDNATVTNSLTLTDGVVNTGVNMLTLSSTTAASLSGGSSDAFVNGIFRRYIANNTSTYEFPIGNGTGTGNFHRAAFYNQNLAGVTYLTAQFGALANHNDIDMNTVDEYLEYTTVNNSGTWKIDANAVPSGGFYNLRLYISNFTGLADNEFGILKRASNSTTAADWTASGYMLEPDGLGRLLSDGFALRTNLTNFSEFGIGEGAQGSGSLPISLALFQAQYYTGQDIVSVSWVTATEIENDYFTVERSLDGVNYTVLGTIDGAGNSNVMKKYLYNDESHVPGISYYRLRQTDMDGSSEVFSAVSVNIPLQNLIQISPSIVKIGGQLKLSFSNHASNIASTISLYQATTGKLVFHSDVTGNMTIPVSADFASGLYISALEYNGAVSYDKIIVE